MAEASEQWEGKGGGGGGGCWQIFQVDTRSYSPKKIQK